MNLQITIVKLLLYIAMKDDPKFMGEAAKLGDDAMQEGFEAITKMQRFMDQNREAAARREKREAAAENVPALAASIGQMVAQITYCEDCGSPMAPEPYEENGVPGYILRCECGTVYTKLRGNRKANRR